MKWLLLSLVMFTSVANARDRLIVSVESSGEKDQKTETVILRPPESKNVFNREKQFFKVGESEIVCEASFFMDQSVIGCEHTVDGKDRVTTSGGFQVSETASCEDGKESELKFSVKTKRGGLWNSIKIRFKCERERT